MAEIISAKQPKTVIVGVEQLKEEIYVELLRYVRTKLEEKGILAPYKMDIEILVRLEYPAGGAEHV